MSSSKDALRNIAMLHITSATWQVIGGNTVRGTNVVSRPTGALTIVYTAVGDKVVCTMALAGSSPFTFTLLDGEAATALFNEKLAEIEEREAAALLKRILQEASPYEQEELWTIPTQPNTPVWTRFGRVDHCNGTLSFAEEKLLTQINTDQKTIEEFYSQYKNKTIKVDQFRDQLKAIEQKYQGQPSKRKK